MAPRPQSVLMVGCGNMGGAMLSGWLAGGLDPAIFTVADPYAEAVPGGVRLLRHLPDGPFDVVVLAIKPQALADASPAVEAILGTDTILLSLLAGVELATLRRRFPRAGPVVRVMPNLSAALGKSPIALAGEGLDARGRGTVDALAAPLGQSAWLDEGQFDLVTALAGSGPAFVYRFIDALGAAAATLGMPEEQARSLALATVEGAAALAVESKHSPGELADRVASPGGTTEAGLKALDAGGVLPELMAKTLRAARDRSAEMAREAKSG